MDLSEYKTNDESELVIYSTNYYLINAIVSTLILSYFSNSFLSSFETDKTHFFKIFHVFILILLLLLALSAWFKVFYNYKNNNIKIKLIRLLINNNGIGYSKAPTFTLFLNILLKQIQKKVFASNTIKTSSYEIDSKTGFFEWGEIYSYQFSIINSGNVAYLLELNLKIQNNPIKIKIDYNLEFDKIKNKFELFSEKHSILNLGFSLKDNYEYAGIKKATENNKSNTNFLASNELNIHPDPTNYSNDNEIKPLSFDEKNKIDNDFIVKMKKTPIWVFIILLFMLLSILSMPLGILTNAILHLLVGDKNNWLHLGIGVVILEIAIIYSAIRFRIKRRKKIRLFINNDGITQNNQTYFWKDISNYYFEISIVLVPRGGGKGGSSGFKEEMQNTLILTSKSNCKYRIEIKNKWDKTTTQIHNAIINATKNYGVEDLGLIKTSSNRWFNYYS